MSASNSGSGDSKSLRHRRFLTDLWNEVNYDDHCKLCNTRDNLCWAPHGFIVKSKKQVKNYDTFRKNLNNWGFFKGISPRATAFEKNTLSIIITTNVELWYQEDDRFRKDDVDSNFELLRAIVFRAPRKRTKPGQTDTHNTTEQGTEASTYDSEKEVGDCSEDPSTTCENNDSQTRQPPAPTTAIGDSGRGSNTDGDDSLSRTLSKTQWCLPFTPIEMSAMEDHACHDCITRNDKKRQKTTVPDLAQAAEFRTCEARMSEHGESEADSLLEAEMMSLTSMSGPSRDTNPANDHTHSHSHSSRSPPKSVSIMDPSPHETVSRLQSTVRSLCNNHFHRKMPKASGIDFQLNGDLTQATMAYGEFADQLQLLLKISYLPKDQNCNEDDKKRHQTQKFDWWLPEMIDQLRQCTDQETQSGYFEQRDRLKRNLQELLDAHFQEQFGNGEGERAYRAAVDALACQLQLLQRIAFRPLTKDAATINGDSANTSSSVEVPIHQFEVGNADNADACENVEGKNELLSCCRGDPSEQKGLSDSMNRDGDTAVSRRSLARSKISCLRHKTDASLHTPRLSSRNHISGDVFVWMDGIRVHAASLRCGSLNAAIETLRIWQQSHDHGSEANLRKLQLIMSSASQACSSLSHPVARIAARGCEIIATYYHLGFASLDWARAKRKAQEILQRTIDDTSYLQKLTKKKFCIAPPILLCGKALLNAFRKLSYLVHSLEPMSENSSHPVSPELVSSIRRRCKQFVYIENHLAQDEEDQTVRVTLSSGTRSHECDETRADPTPDRETKSKRKEMDSRAFRAWRRRGARRKSDLPADRESNELDSSSRSWKEHIASSPCAELLPDTQPSSASPVQGKRRMRGPELLRRRHSDPEITLNPVIFLQRARSEGCDSVPADFPGLTQKNLSDNDDVRSNPVALRHAKSQKCDVIPADVRSLVVCDSVQSVAVSNLSEEYTTLRPPDTRKRFSFRVNPFAPVHDWRNFATPRKQRLRGVEVIDDRNMSDYKVDSNPVLLLDPHLDGIPTDVNCAASVAVSCLSRDSPCPAFEW